MVNLTVQIATRVALFEIARMREGAVLCLLRNHICWLTAAACTEKAAGERERERGQSSQQAGLVCFREDVLHGSIQFVEKRFFLVGSLMRPVTKALKLPLGVPLGESLVESFSVNFM